MLMIEKMATRYFAGTASVQAGGTIVTPHDALWAGNIWGDDLFFLPSQPLVPPQRIETVNDDGTLTLAVEWPGATETEVAYEIRYVGIIERSTAQTRAVLEQLGDVKAYYDVQVDTLADRDAFDSRPAGYRVLVSDIGDGRAAIYSKATSADGDWTAAAMFSGPVGPIADITVSGTTTLAPGSAATVTPTPTPEGVALEFGIPAGRGATPRGTYDPATAYVLDDAVLDNGSTWIALQDTTGNAPPILPTTSNAFWQLLARAGMDGAGTVTTVVGGTGVSVDTTDPTAPVVSVAREVAAKSANYTVVAGDNGNVITVDASGAARTITLLPAATAGNGFKLIVKKSDSSANTVTIDGDGSETIDGETTKVLRLQHQSVALICDGTAWHVMGEGAVFASGGNANGRYTRWADGTQMVWNAAIAALDVNVANGSMYISTSTADWTFPAAFVGAPSVMPGYGGSSNGLRWVTIGSVASTGCSVRAISPSQSAVTLNVGASAVGAWF